MNRRTRRASLFAIAALAPAVLAPSVEARPEDTLLEETVEFAGTFIFLEAKAPAAIIGVVKDGEMVVRGFGEISDGSGKEPEGNTMMRVGSITKVFAGAALASMVADGKIEFRQAPSRLGWDVKIPTKDGKQIRLIDLATHASGLPREAPVGTGDRRRRGVRRIMSPRSRRTFSSSHQGRVCCIRISASTFWRRRSQMPTAGRTRIF